MFVPLNRKIMNYGQRDYNTRLDEETGYKYVYAIINRSGNKKYEAKVKVGNTTNSSYYDTPREAAKKVDLELLKQGKKPVNGTLTKK